MDATVFLARFIGFSFVIVTLSMLFDKAKAIQAIKSFLADDGSLFLLEMISTVLGLAVVLTHSVWTGHGTTSFLVTLIGWIFLVRGVIGLFISDLSLRKLYHLIHFEDIYYYAVAIIFLLGLALTYGGFKA